MTLKQMRYNLILEMTKRGIDMRFAIEEATIALKFIQPAKTPSPPRKVKKA